MVHQHRSIQFKFEFDINLLALHFNPKTKLYLRNQFVNIIQKDIKYLKFYLKLLHWNTIETDLCRVHMSTEHILTQG